MTAVQLSTMVWLVGTSEQDSRAFTSAYDCSQYLIWDGHHGILIDSGSGLNSTGWLNNITEIAPLERISRLLITHYHADHAGGAGAAQARGLQVFASEVTAEALANGDESITQLARARASGIYPTELRAAPTADLHILRSSQHFELGNIAVTVIDSPGHCNGHLVFEIELGSLTALFSGDVVFAGGKISMQAIPDCRLDLYADTVIALAGRSIDQLYAGHGAVVLEGAGEHLRLAAEPFARLVPPPNLLS